MTSEVISVHGGAQRHRLMCVLIRQLVASLEVYAGSLSF